MKQLKRLTVSLVSAIALAFALALPAFAQDTYTEVSGKQDAITISKVLDLKGAEATPSHTVTFSVTGGTNTEDTTYAAAGSVPSVTLTYGPGDAPTDGKVTKTDMLDFDNVTFPVPGVYRFTLTETDISNPAVKPTKNDTYEIDVYVDNVVTETGLSDLKVVDYVLHKAGETARIKTDTADFENEYESFTLDVAKQVTGNQGNKKKEFTITVTFANGIDGDKYAVKMVNGTPKVNGSAVTEEGIEIAANSTVTLKLKDTDQVQFYGIPKDVTYTVVEAEANQDGYTTTGEVKEAKTITQDESEVVVNDKNGTVPTGIFVNNMPYIVMSILAIAVAIVVVRKRNNHFNDEL